MIKQDVTFLALNGLLLGKDIDTIRAALDITAKELADAMGFESLEEYKETTKDAKPNYDLTPEDKVIINYFSLQEYLFGTLDLGEKKQLLDVEILRHFAYENTPEYEMSSLLMEYFPTIKTGKKICMIDGVLYLPEKYGTLEKQRKLILKNYDAKYRGKPIIKSHHTKVIMENYHLGFEPKIKPNQLRTIIDVAARNGYLLSAVNDLLQLQLHDYVQTYMLTGTVMASYDDQLHVLTHSKDTDKCVIAVIPEQIMVRIAKSPKLFAESYYDDGYIYVKTNVGYKQFFMQEEVVV